MMNLFNFFLKNNNFMKKTYILSKFLTSNCELCSSTRDKFLWKDCLHFVSFLELIVEQFSKFHLNPNAASNIFEFLENHFHAFLLPILKVVLWLVWVDPEEHIWKIKSCFGFSVKLISRKILWNQFHAKYYCCNLLEKYAYNNLCYTYLKTKYMYKFLNCSGSWWTLA